ncbi:UDP-3-O-(3-hydroxymyristoyl)glucosamine N-acyltransferase [Mediterraneibacter glycyrrhizinilyticus]|uniref:UDP-3-O-(3-hydroxymyristoyl)glucosamine N-acyltransferase n=1 Tax=Mediterraneibacter glycyrrhizinilyticus TaxID=342942 RepID=UPI0025A49A44|nr:UDP-3-O-(3-hydroxymyristoyl)glucosamine N-acyltransferase [Mediterraneibacter glycyrrhizinilyticus]MDM8212018.1 UDP-3-O-(3-hydroxymyristoyl)glucosamine N-acyltransferase [Mediterraneibacter glycyrrhizinilyticus]
MLLSEILKDMDYPENYEIPVDNSFEVLALTASVITAPSCIFLDSEKYLDDIKENMEMICCTENVAAKLMERGWKKGICITENPRIMFFMVHNFLSENNSYPYQRKQFKTKIGANCKIHESASISENNVVIGDNVVIEEFVVIRENTVIGDNTIIRAGAKIGGTGFEFKRVDNEILSVKHAGGVSIGKNVEIQYNTCIDRAVYPWDDTMIGDFSKIDNLVHIGHAVKVAENVLIVAQSGIGGRTHICSNSWIGFASTVSNGLMVGKESRVNIGSVATKNVEDYGSVTGNFAIDHAKFIRNLKKMNE